MKHRNISWPWLAAVIVLVSLQLLLQFRAVRVARQYPTLGVEFAAPLTAEQVDTAATWQQSSANTNGITASYWGSIQAAVSTDLGHTAADTTCIGYAGTAADCLPADYVQGSAPGAVGQQCAVSTTLAWQLFGSYGILGQTVTLNRTDYTISGVFTAKTGILLYPAHSGFTHAALRGISEDAPKADAAQWAAAAGLPTLQKLDYGPQRVWLARALCHLPAVLVGFCLLAAFLGLAHSAPPVIRHTAYFAAALAFALLVPYFLQSLPGWLIPGRWSDFSFWPRLLQQIQNEI